MRRPTVSEVLFESYCSRNAVPFSRIPTDSGRRTPDYCVELSENSVVAEVKQFDPTDLEEQLQRLFETEGFTPAFGGKPGQRASQSIKDGVKQLRLLGKNRYPTLLVFYNNVPITNRHVDPYAIKTAMYGLEAMILGVPGESDGPPTLLARQFGGRRTLTPAHNTTLSAVAVLSSNPVDNSPSLRIFHNIYAFLPLNPDWLRNTETRHYTLGEKHSLQFQEWIEL